MSDHFGVQFYVENIGGGGSNIGMGEAAKAAADGSIFVIHRCFANSCAGRPEPPILKFDANGKLLKAFGNGMFIFPHGSALDPDGKFVTNYATGDKPDDMAKSLGETVS